MRISPFFDIYKALNMAEKPTYEELQKTIKNLEERAETYRELIDNSPDLLYRSDLKGRITYISPSVLRLSGYTVEEAIGMRLAEEIYLHPEEREAFLSRLMEKGRITNFEARLKRKDGSIWWASANAHILKDKDGIVLGVEGVVRDISELKTAESSLKSSEERFRLAFHDSPDSINLNRVADGMYVDINQGFTDLTGFTRDDVRGKSSLEINIWKNPDDRARMVAELRKTGSVKNFEAQFVRKDGDVGVGLMSARVLKINNENVIFSITRDISERKNAEEALRHAEEQNRLLLEQVHGVLWTVDKNLRFTSSRGAGLSSLGLKPDQIVGQRLKDFLGRDDAIAIQAAKEAFTGKSVKYEEKFGNALWESRVEPLRDQTGRIVGSVAISLDITEREKLQAQLIQAQKMESVGRLAGGVAHDFNNMLSVILGRSDLVLSEMKADNPHYTEIKEIFKAGLRSADLTRQLLAFARKQAIVPTVLDLNETVEKMFKMLRRLIGENIDLVWKPSSHIWPVLMDPAQLDQILANLCLNARDAITGPGRIMIETEVITFDAEYCENHPGFQPGPYVMIAVSDDGCGMDKETQTHIFEPFFTTKAEGKGTGLGMATVYGIVKQNNGFINVYSEPEKGSSFKIYLPRAEEKIDAQKTPAVTERPKGTETLLMTEDEEAVLMTGKAMLEQCGYTVLPALTPGEAISIAEKYEGTIHLLITDVVMPEMNGKDLKENISRLIPGIRVLFMSGYTGEVLTHLNDLENDIHFLQKPFSIDSLTRKVREVLDFKM